MPGNRSKIRRVPIGEESLRPLSRHSHPRLAASLISRTRIDRRVRELAALIQMDYQDRELVIVALLTGTVMFLADLIRNIDLPLRLDFMGVSSYGAGVRSGGLVYTKELRLEVRGREVLVVDDILDSGRTLQSVLAKIETLQPKSLRTCVLLKKNVKRTIRIRPRYVGFNVPDRFVVGYGLDFAEQFRNLPFVAVLKPESYGGV